MTITVRFFFFYMTAESVPMLGRLPVFFHVFYWGYDSLQVVSYYFS